VTDTIHQTRGAGAAKTIALSDRDLRDAVRLLNLLLADQVEPDTRTGAVDNVSREDLVERAVSALSKRQRRSAYFPKSFFGEPAWDMLLILYVNERSGTRFTIARLSEQCGASPSTALRWIDILEGGHFVCRQPNPIDQRTVFIKLSDKARDALDGYFSSIVIAPRSEISR